MAINLEKSVTKAVITPGPRLHVREEWSFVDSTLVSTVEGQENDGVIGSKRIERIVTPQTHSLAQITNYVQNQVDDDQIDILGICTALWST